MTRNGPSFPFERTKIATAIGELYRRPDTLELIHSSREVIKEVLYAHIAQVNPNLARELMTATTEGKVLAIIGQIGEIKAANDDIFNQQLAA